MFSIFIQPSHKISLNQHQLRICHLYFIKRTISCYWVKCQDKSNEVEYLNEYLLGCKKGRKYINVNENRAFTIIVACSLDDLNKMPHYMFIITILFMMLLVRFKYLTNSFTPSGQVCLYIILN